MPVLHFRIKQANEIINIPQQLNSQQFIFKRCVVIKDNQTTVNYGGGCAIKLDFLNGVEIVSNQNNEMLYIPFKDDDTISDRRYDLNFNSETVKRSFKASVYFYNDNTQQPVFDTTGATASAIRYIDLYFEFQSIYDYNAY
jgi:hypothetical protein